MAEAAERVNDPIHRSAARQEKIHGKKQPCLLSDAKIRILTGHRSFWTVLILASCGSINEYSPPIDEKLSGTISEYCNISANNSSFSAARGANSKMSVTSDGGWCSLAIREIDGPKNFGRLTDAPKHGEVRFRQSDHIPYNSRLFSGLYIDYRPVPGYVGQDEFVVRTTPANGYFPVSVTVGLPNSLVANRSPRLPDTGAFDTCFSKTAGQPPSAYKSCAEDYYRNH